jgi:spermidine synthase
VKRILFLTGFFSVLSQVVLLRELNVAYFGVELIYTLALGVWLLGSALGALINRKNAFPDIHKIFLLLFIAALIIPCDIIFIRGARILSGEASGVYLPFYFQILLLIISLVPISALTGFAFQRSAKLFISDGKSLALAYSIESAGGIAGGIMSALPAALNISNFSTGLFCVLSVFLFIDYKFILKKNRYFLLFPALIFAITLFLLCNTHKIDIASASWNHINIVETKDTPYNRISISNNLGQISVFEDDALCYESETTDAEEFCQISLLLVDKPKRVLALGGGYQGILNEIIKLKYVTVDYVEFNKSLSSILTPYLNNTFGNALASGRITAFYMDPKTFLKNANYYDAIIINMPEPTSGQTNRFYTKEFFSLCSKHLSNNGIIAFRMKSAENLWSPVLLKRNTSIYKTLKSSFNDVVVFPGTVNIFAASQNKLELNPDVLSNRLLERQLNTKIVTPQYIKYILSNDRFDQIRRLMDSTNSTELNTDNKPVCYRYTSAIWLSKFFPEYAYINFNTINPYNLISFGIFAVLFFAFIKAFKKIKKYILISVVSFQGMILELSLILRYQTESGILYQNIGILITVFMLGLSAGSYVLNRIEADNVFMPKQKKLTGVILILLFALLNLCVGIFFKTAEIVNLTIISVLLFSDGFLVSAVFAFLSRSRNDKQNLLVSPLYSADLIGGCIGAILGGLFFIPSLGLSEMLIYSGILSAISLLLN